MTLSDLIAAMWDRRLVTLTDAYISGSMSA